MKEIRLKTIFLAADSKDLDGGVLNIGSKCLVLFLTHLIKFI